MLYLRTEKMKTLRILTVAALASASTLAMADQSVITEDGIASFSTFKPGSVRAEVGTTGYGGAISWSANPYVGITLGYNGGDISWSDDIKVNGTTYDLEMDNDNAYINAEIRPFANWLYIAAGVALTNNEYKVEKRIAAGETLRFDGGNYQLAAGTTSGYVKGKAEYDNDFVPYVGFGFSPAITNRFGVFGEIGAYYTGNPTVTLTHANLVPVTGNTTSIQDAVENEARKIENDDKFKFLPVAKVGLSVRF